MTAGAFITLKPMVEAFGLHEMKNKAEAIRRVWPSFPKGKGELTIGYAAHLVYIFASTYSIKDIHDKRVIQRIRKAKVDIVAAISDLLQDSTQLQEVLISKKSGDVSIIYSNGACDVFMTGKENEVNDVDDVVLIKREFFQKVKDIWGDFSSSDTSGDHVFESED